MIYGQQKITFNDGKKKDLFIINVPYDVAPCDWPLRFKRDNLVSFEKKEHQY